METKEIINLMSLVAESINNNTPKSEVINYAKKVLNIQDESILEHLNQICGNGHGFVIQKGGVNQVGLLPTLEAAKHLGEKGGYKGGFILRLCDVIRDKEC